MRISDQDHARIAAAVAQAEAMSSGEIRCVLSARTTHGWTAALIFGALSALVLPAIALLAGFDPQTLTRPLSGWQAATDERTLTAVSAYVACQALVFAAVAGVWLIPPVRRLLTLPGLTTARVRRAAIAQFQSLGLTGTRDRTGVLLFASLDDRRAQVLADKGIYEKTTPEDWQCVADLLVAGLSKASPTDGFVSAVGKAGELLAAQFPPRDDDTNELPDGLITTRS